MGEEILLFTCGKKDLVITDNEMPRLNGTDLCAHLLEERPFIRIIMMTGEKREERKGDLELPLLQKPFGRAALIEKVREVLAIPRLPEA